MSTITKRIQLKQQTHQRIIARLYALALLCERAAGMPACVRFMVLWILRSGEVVARDFAAGMAFDAGYRLHLSDLPTIWQSSRPDDTIHLALQFRALADVLQFLSAYVELEAKADAHLSRMTPGMLAYSIADLAGLPQHGSTSLHSPARGPPSRPKLKVDLLHVGTQHRRFWCWLSHQAASPD